MDPGKIFGLMKGCWKVSRKIQEPQKNWVTGEGKARFEAISNDPKVLLYKEELQILTNSEKFDVSKEYVFRYLENKISVFFKEKPERFFYSLEFQQPSNEVKVITAQAEHLCIKDLYKAQYKFFDDNKFELIYQVKGPKKNYLMTTIYDRIKEFK